MSPALCALAVAVLLWCAVLAEEVQLRCSLRAQEVRDMQPVPLPQALAWGANTVALDEVWYRDNGGT